MKSFRVFEDGQRKLNGFTLQLTLDAFERPLHRNPEINLLRCRTGSDIPIELCDCLNLLRPGVHVGLKLVEK